MTPLPPPYCFDRAMANNPDKESDEAKAAPRKFTYSTGKSKTSDTAGSLKIGGNAQPTIPASKPLPSREISTPSIPEPRPESTHPDILFDEAPTSVHNQPTELSKPSPAVSKEFLVVEGIAAIVSITFAALLFQDLLPYL